MRKLLFCACFTFSAFSAVAQQKDCKTILDSLERLKCYDGQPSTTPSPAVPDPFVPAFKAQILKIEPPVGQLPPGAKVLIDDGTCPTGQLKQVVGGNVTTGQARLRFCVPRP